MPHPFFIGIILVISCLLSPKNNHIPADKAARLRQVYARLVRTIGSPPDVPVLHLLPRQQAGATSYVVYRPGNPARIDMNEAVLDLCLQLGADADAAMACLLGHELAHFQYRHGGKQGFFSPVLVPNGAPYSSENLEALADRSGTFMTYLAGYDAFTIAPVIYRKLYDTFNLPNQIKGYPTKDQRLRMVADTTARVQELAQLFEIGEVSYLLHDYDAASRAFSALVARYPTAITLNNLGAVKLNQALARMPSARTDSRLRFLFPIEFDADNRLLANPRRGESLPYQALLTDALHLFTTALAEQPTYQPARLNAAITAYLLDRNDQAQQLLTSQTPLSANRQLMMGIIQADLGELTKARTYFQRATKQGAFRALENSRLFEEAQKPGWLRYWQQMMAKRQTTQAREKPFPHWPVPVTNQLSWRPMPLLGGVRYARTDSLTAYELPVTNNGKTSLHRVVKSTQLPLSGLPFGSAPSRLSAIASPMAVMAGARETMYYSYAQGDQRLLVAYRQNRLVSWLFVK